MRLCCCKKIIIKNRTKEVKNGNITIETDPSFDVPIFIIILDGFLTSTCRVWPKMSKKEEESPEHVRKFPFKRFS